MKSLPALIFTTLLFISSAHAFTTSSQPAEERKAQNSLPIASGTAWNTLAESKISYSDKPPHITAKLTPNIKAMNGRTLSVSGFMLPLDSGEKSTHFLLSKRTPTCPFCPPGEPNEVIEVFTAKGVPYDDSMLTLEGTFQLTNNTDNGVFFVLKPARLVTAQKVAPSAPQF